MTFFATLSPLFLNGSNGFRIEGVDVGGSIGYSVASAGDVNGDGFDDIVIGERRANPEVKEQAEKSYVIFGAASGFEPALKSSDLNGTNGFQINGVNEDDRSGVSVASAGDVNGDGFDDVVIGAYDADPEGKDRAGESYVVFGAETGFAPALNLSGLNGTNGFQINGKDESDLSGGSVASAGDVNGDGFDDIIIGTYAADPDEKDRAGESYVIFGAETGFTPALKLSDLNGNNGFKIDGLEAYDHSGVSVASAGDVNGDGFDDIIIGAPEAAPGGKNSAGESYVIFGGPNGFVVPEILGTAAADVLIGTDESEFIEGLGGNDWILPDSGSDRIDGGDGIDMVSYAGQSGPLTFAQNDDRGIATIADILDEIYNIEGVTGTSQADTFYASDGYFRGLGGQDTFVASGAGLGCYDGGASRDTLSYESSSTGVSASLLRDRGWSGDAQGDQYSSIENLITSNHDDFIWGDRGNNKLEGLHGDDVIVGNRGDDYILAGFGTDTIVFSGNRADYTITQDGIRTEVTDNVGNDGHDVIGHAEILRFADGDLIL